MVNKLYDRSTENCAAKIKKNVCSKPAFHDGAHLPETAEVR